MEEPATVIMSRAIEEIQKQDDYQVMVAIVKVDEVKTFDRTTISTYCDIDSKELREEVYERFEKDAEVWLSNEVGGAEGRPRGDGVPYPPRLGGRGSHA